MSYPDTEIANISENILGLMMDQDNVLHYNGWKPLTDFEGFSSNEISDWVLANQRLTAVCSGSMWPPLKVKCLKALV